MFLTFFFWFSAYATNFKRTIQHPRPFRASPLIHASSQNHFTQPIDRPTNSESDEEQFIRPQSVIYPPRNRKPENKRQIPLRDNSIQDNDGPTLNRNNAIKHSR
jgi:hypothetical protein